MNTRVAIAAAGGALAGVVAFAMFIAVSAQRLDTGSPQDTAASTPAATAPALMQAESGYAVWDTEPDGTPTRWDPCSPIPWVMDLDGAPEGARETVTLAMARITAASGLEFSFEGITDERPSRDRPLVVEGEDGPAWAPVLISWEPGGSTDLPLGDDERGVAVPVAVRDDGPRIFVTGQVVLNADKTLLPRFEDRHASWGAVVLHELMHVVGLDHVDDPRQLMHPTPGFGPVELGGGDRAGLTAVGADGGCLEVPAPRELAVRFEPIN